MNNIIEKLEIIDKECQKSKSCENCKIKYLCNKYCIEITPGDMINYLKDLIGLEFEEL